MTRSQCRVPWLYLSLLALASPVYAQEAEDESEPGVAFEEEPDSTRLDVERLPPEAVELDRDLYATGLLVEAHLGAEGFVTGLGDDSAPGPRLAVVVGYELFPWAAIALRVEGSMHQTTNNTPPSQTVYENVSAGVDVRLTAPLTARAALWASGQFAMLRSTGDVLRTLGYQDADGWMVLYGGELGFDWHVWGLHHSLGLTAGARLYPGLSTEETSIAVHGGPYLRYVL